MCALPDASNSFETLLKRCASLCESCLPPAGRSQPSLAIEASATSLPPLPADALVTGKAFEKYLKTAGDEPLPTETEEEGHLKCRHAKRLCALANRTVDQAIILEDVTNRMSGFDNQIQVRGCDLLMRPRFTEKNPSHNVPLVDEELINSKNTTKSIALSWDQVSHYLHTKLKDSFHIIYVIITDEIVQNECQWAIQFLEACFIHGGQFNSQTTNLVLVPWFKTTMNDIPDSIARLSVQSVRTISSGVQIKVGEIIKQVIMHRFIFLASLFFDHFERGFDMRHPDLAEFGYTIKFVVIFIYGLMNQTDEQNPDTDANVLGELLVHLHPFKERLIGLIAWCISSPKRWTRESIQLEAGQTVLQLYMNTLYYGHYKRFALGRLFKFILANSAVLPGISGKDIIFRLDVFMNNLRQTISGLKLALTCDLQGPEGEHPNVYQLIDLTSQLRGIPYLAAVYQEPPCELLELIQLCPVLIQSLIHTHENSCGLIEVTIFELLFCELQLFAIISSKNSLSKVVEFAWNLLTAIANTIEASARVIMKFSTLETKAFKREFTGEILKVLGEVLLRASEVLSAGVCTEPHPEETLNRLEQCVERLDFDQWYTRIHDWGIDSPDLLHGLNNTRIHAVLGISSLKHLANMCQMLEKRFRIRYKSQSSTAGEREETAILLIEERRPNSPVGYNEEDSQASRSQSGSSAISTISCVATAPADYRMFQHEEYHSNNLFGP